MMHGSELNSKKHTQYGRILSFEIGLNGKEELEEFPLNGALDSKDKAILLPQYTYI